MHSISQHECNENAHKRNTANAFLATMEQPSRTVVHAKLEMTTPDSPEEVEAEAAANDIVQGGKIARSIFAGGAGGGVAVSSQMEGRLNSMQGGGQAIPDGLRNMMERGFNHDFSQVRLHTDSEAASLSSSIHAKAFTHGNDIYFNQGQFSPNTSEGQKLMAHELAHVAQGGGKIARDEENNSTWDNLWNNYPAIDNPNYNPEDPYSPKRLLQYGEEEECIAKIFYLVALKNDKEAASLLNGIKDEKIKNSVMKFIQNEDYKEKFLEWIQHDEEDARAYIYNIARTFLLYGLDFYHKENRNLDDYANGCAVRVSIALAKSGMKIRQLPSDGQYNANGFEYFNDKSFKVTIGPSFFKTALDEQFKNNKKAKGPSTVELTTKKNYPKYPIIEELRKKQNAGPLTEAEYTAGLEIKINECQAAEKFVAEKFKGKKGIIVMITNNWHHAGGHVTLWDGEKAADSLDVDYPNKKNMRQTFYLYEFQYIKWTKF